MIPKKEIQYLANDKEIDGPHHIYYLQTLGLYGRKGITHDGIIKASSCLLEEERWNHNKLPIIDTNEIKAAKFFLLDQLTHLVMLN